MSFDDLGLGEEVLRAVKDAGYTEPTPIQAQAIPLILMGRDLLGMAQTGTGKTAGFTLPMIDILAKGRAKARMPRSLILEPTRELATQVSESFETYGKHHKLTKALLIGGESVSEQQKKLDRGVDVLIATPGRLIDLFERGNILLTDVKVFVIDEADRMLDMGFIPDIERIAKLLPPLRQTLFFSATFPPVIRKLADQFLQNPKEVRVAPPASTADLVEDFLTVVDDKDKRAALRALLKSEEVSQALIFCNRKKDVDILTRSLKQHGFDAEALHGDMAQSSRTRTLDAFRDNKITLLVCSDVAARGLDISDLSHVFNFDVPMHAEDYIHRIGRTGRAGKKGRAFSLAAPFDGKFVAGVEGLIKREITRHEIDGIETLELSEGDGRGRGGRGGGGRSGSRDGGRDGRRGGGRSGGRGGGGESESPTKDAAGSDAGGQSDDKPKRGRRRRSSASSSERPVEAGSNGTPVAASAEKKPAAKKSAARKPRAAAATTTRKGGGGTKADKTKGEKAFGGDMPAFLMQKVKPGGAENG